MDFPQISAGVDHRGVFGTANAPLFPPPDTFDALGGRDAVARLVDGLYDRIEKDKVLRPAFLPNLDHEREKVKLFFEAWLGGAQTYFDAGWRQGLASTHRKISISRGMAGKWVGHFLDSLAEVTDDPAVIGRIKPSVTRLAMALVNRPDEPVRGERLRGGCSITDQKVFLQAIQRGGADDIRAAAERLPKVPLVHGPMLLLVAASRGKLGAAEALLDLGVPVNALATVTGSDADALGLPALPVTPLCGALAKRRDAVVQLLVGRGAVYDIFTAACVGDIDSVRTALDAAPELADIHDPGCDVAGITPLLHAVFAGQTDVARLLLDRGATVGPNSVRMLREAANAGNEALTGMLLDHGADASPIGAGSWVMHPSIAEKLRAKGASVNYEPGRWIGLCCTGNSGHKENVAYARALLDAGADVHAVYKGRTALHCAAMAGFTHVVELLISHGADVHALDDRGRTPLDAIADAGPSVDVEPVRRLLVAQPR